MKVKGLTALGNLLAVINAPIPAPLLALVVLVRVEAVQRVGVRLVPTHAELDVAGLVAGLVRVRVRVKVRTHPNPDPPRRLP